MQNSVADRGGTVADEWSRPGDHLIKHNAEAEEVGAMIHLLTE